MAQSKKAQIKTTDRGGMVRLTLGCISLALGMGWLLGMLLDTTSAWRTLRLFRDTANGLAGALCMLLPAFAVWAGGLWYASARRRVSPRVFLCALFMFLCLLAILTLTTYVGGRDITLMDYIGNNNKTTLGMINNTSYGAYLTGAYNMRAFNMGKLAGGGMLGMLLAYPLNNVFGVAGSVTLLAALMLGALLVMIRMNPADLISMISNRRYRREESQRQEEYQDDPGAEQQPMWDQGIQVPMQPIIPQQEVRYTGTSVQSDTVPSYLVEDRDFAPAQPAVNAPQGFVPVQSGVLYEEHIPVSDQPAAEKPARRRRSGQKQEEAQPVLRPEPQPVPRAQAQPEAQPAPKEDNLPWYEDQSQIPPIEEAPAAQPAAKAASVVTGGRHTSGEVERVYTDPAVPLTGERISITGQNNDRPRIDPFEVKHTAEALKRVNGEYVFPPLRLLREPKQQRVDTSAEDEARAKLLEHTLASFNIEARVEYVVHGPAITRFALRLADGVNVNRLNTVSNNLAMSMKAVGLRIEIPIPGTSLVGIEVPNEKVSMVTLKEVLDSDIMRANPSPTAVAIGKDITGQPICCDLSDMPHMLIAGATGSGKSVCINSIIQSILYRATPQQVRLLMIDPKLVELQPYNGIPHLLTEVVSDPKKAAAALDWLVQEMGDRYRRFQQLGVRNIAGYNKKMTNPADHMPDIVAIIDEFSDLMVQCRKQVEESIQRLAALARAAGIYMIVATQRPSVDVITGVIKANIPSRIAFAVANNVDSRTIIDSVGAEKLLGKGDMLYFPRSEFRPVRVQGCFVSDGEVQDIADYVKEHNEALYDQRVDEHMEKATQEQEQQAAGKEPDYEMQADTENELLQRAIEMAVESGQMSISMLRRRLGLGHSRAGKLIDTMANMGIVSQDEGPKPRRTLITREDYLKMQAEILDQ
ncbi:MAG: DNA translocase FtsK [Clostridia bacterium]|nr:DNA translocase FtsK [Clostridia bacterium]